MYEISKTSIIIAILIAFGSEVDICKGSFQVSAEGSGGEQSTPRFYCGESSEYVELETCESVEISTFMYGNLSYTNNLNCSSFVRAAHPTDSMRVIIIDMEIELQSTCSFDEFVIRERGSSSNLQRLCGTFSNITNIYPENNLELRFTTDFSIVERGFLVEFTAFNPSCNGPQIPIQRFYCGETEEVLMLSEYESVEISSFEYGTNNYTNKLRCLSKVQTSNSSNCMKVKIINMDLENSLQCNKDFVKLREIGTNNHLLKLCGQHSNKLYLFTENNLKLRFKTDRSTTGEGFLIRFTAIPGPCDPIVPPTTIPRFYCGQYDGVYKLYLNKSVEISSFEYGTTDYAPDTSCIFKMKTQGRNKNIKVNIINMDIEDSTHCANDNIRLLKAGRRKILYKSCGVKSNIEFTLPVRRLQLKFQSNSANQGAGFLIRFTAVH